MKRLIYILPVVVFALFWLLLQHSANATFRQAVIAKKNAGGAPPAGHDFTETFDTATPTSYDEATCGVATCWGERASPDPDATNVYRGASGESLYSAANDTSSYISITASDNIVVEFWIYFTCSDEWYQEPIWGMDDSTDYNSDSLVFINLYCDDTQDYIDIGGYEADPTSGVPVSASTWYRIHVDFNKSASADTTMDVYDTGGSPVGSQQTFTTNFTAASVSFGWVQLLGTSAVNYDDVWLDYE